MMRSQYINIVNIIIVIVCFIDNYLTMSELQIEVRNFNFSVLAFITSIDNFTKEGATMNKTYLIAVSGMFSALVALPVSAAESSSQVTQNSTSEKQALVVSAANKTHKISSAVALPKQETVEKNMDTGVSLEVNCFYPEFADDPFCKKHFPVNQ